MGRPARTNFQVSCVHQRTHACMITYMKNTDTDIDSAPCADCGKPCHYDYGDEAYHHDTPSRCWLIDDFTGGRQTADDDTYTGSYPLGGFEYAQSDDTQVADPHGTLQWYDPYELVVPWRLRFWPSKYDRRVS